MIWFYFFWGLSGNVWEIFLGSIGNFGDFSGDFEDSSGIERGIFGDFPGILKIIREL